MAINKVVYGQNTIIDITDTTAVATDVASGKYFYLANGQKVSGTASGGVDSGDVWQDEFGLVHLSDEPGTNVLVSPLSITSNGTYIAPSGTAYSPVTVDVPSTGTKYTATFVGSRGGRAPDTTIGKPCYVSHNDTVYINATGSFEFEAGDTLYCYASGSDNGQIFLIDNGVSTDVGTRHSEYYNVWTDYEYTLPARDITIELYYGSEAYIKITSNTPIINISTNGQHSVVDYDIANVDVPISGIAADDIAMRTISGAIGGNASNIYPYAFLNCSALSQVNFPSCTTIATNAFASCSALSQISFPLCTTIGMSAFHSCRALPQVSFPSCTKIEPNAFQNCYALSQASFPLCTTIGSYAFQSCSALSQISFPVCSSIATSAFAYCYSLSQISFPVCSSIGAYAFANCSVLSQISFPSCTTIGSNAFLNCYALSQASFSLCTTIGSYAFQNCSVLSQISFPSCTTIGSNAFVNCYSLSQISFPVCSSIGSSAFRSCSFVTTAIFNNISTASGIIYTSAFLSCFRLLSLYLLASSGLYRLNSAFSSTFNSTPMYNNTTYTDGIYGNIFVPSSLYDSYTTANNWSLYSSRIASLTDIEIQNVLTYGRHDP